MSPKDLKAFLKIMRANGVTSFKADGVEINLAHDALFPNPKGKPQEEVVPAENKMPAWMQYTPEELATWSAPNVNETDEAN